MNGIYSKTDNYTLIHDDMLNMGEYIKDGTIDAVITDPPYELGFMNKSWDNSGIAFRKETWAKCFNALKDGGYLLAFGGTRTFHRIACAIEDAGFEIRDCIMYLYGSGFPKSHNIGLSVDKNYGEKNRGHRIATASRYHPDGTFEPNGEKLEAYEGKTEKGKQWQGWGTALKPAYEPIIVARKPMRTSVAENVLKNGVGGINIDECRIETEDFYSMPEKKTPCAVGYQRKNKSMFTDKNASEMNQLGRFPANVIHDGSEEVLDGFPNEDTECPSRFFYTAKASKKDRDEGLEAFDLLTVSDGREKSIDNAFQRGETPRRNTHPTVKPIELMQYLIKMVSPKGATILDPFMGSGSTGKAAMFENRERNANYKFVGIELTEEYLPICQARIEYAINKYEYDEKLEQEKTGQASLFDFDFGVEE